MDWTVRNTAKNYANAARFNNTPGETKTLFGM